MGTSTADRDHCRGCGGRFAKTGFGARSESTKRLCRDCVIRETSYHGRHSPQTECLAKYL